jgi:hypothetical protein
LTPSLRLSRPDSAWDYRSAVPLLKITEDTFGLCQMKVLGQHFNSRFSGGRKKVAGGAKRREALEIFNLAGC